MSSNILSRLSQRFKNGQGSGESGGAGANAAGRTTPDLLTRDIGGHFRNNQPYVSGYFYVMFGLPYALYAPSTGGGSDTIQTASKWLHSTCEGFTPHSTSVTAVDVQGIGQTGASFPVNVTTSREITLTFREYQNLPILNIVRQWAGVFDPFTGTSPLRGKNFIPANYKGWCAVMQTKPTGSHGDGNSSFDLDDIEECYIYQGVFPTTVPVDTVSSEDQTGNDTVQVSVTFKFDGHPMTSSEPGIAEKVIELFNGIHMLDTTFKTHHDSSKQVKAWSSPQGSVTTQNTKVGGITG